MYNDNRILAIIPARGGSKGIPHKNIIDLCGKPLIQYTIDAALGSKYIDYVMVSTDDEEIAKVSKRLGAQVPFLRPSELATDKSKTLDGILFSIEKLKEKNKVFSSIILLQPTSPLRTSDDVDGAIETFYAKSCKPLVAVCEVDDNPLLIRKIENDNLISLLSVSSTCRRQDMQKYYKINGAIYINRTTELNSQTSFNDNEVPYVMEKSHSVDIDEMIDLLVARYYLGL